MDKYYTTGQVADMLGCRYQDIISAIHNRNIPEVKLKVGKRNRAWTFDEIATAQVYFAQRKVRRKRSNG